MRIIMIRHGETFDNVKKQYSSEDTRLTDKGREEIERTKLLLEEFEYEKAYVSPLKRAKETQEILDIKDAEEDNRLKEIDFGKFIGYDFNSLKEAYPKEMEYWLEDYIHNPPLEGESIYNLYNRVENFLEEKILENKDILLICHDGVIKSALGWVFNRYDYFFRFRLNNGSISVINIDKEFKYIEKLNYI